MVFSQEICRLCLNYTENHSKFNEPILNLITFLVKSNRFFPREYVSSLLIHENTVCDTCVKCLRTAVKLKQSQTATYEHLTSERKKLHLENLSLNKMSMFNNTTSGDALRACSICLKVIKDAGVYLYNHSKNILPPHIVRSMLIYCRLHLSSHIINPVMCYHCWEDLQIVYNFKRSSDEIENLIKYYCEANNKRRINKPDLELVFRVKQHESRTVNSSEDIFEKYLNKNSVKVNKVIGTVNNNKKGSSSSLVISNILETTTKGYCEEEIVQKVPTIRIKNFAKTDDQNCFSTNLIEKNNKKGRNTHVTNNQLIEQSGNTVYSEILNREIFGPFDKEVPKKNNQQNVNNLTDFDIIRESVLPLVSNVENVQKTGFEEPIIRVKQEVLSDYSDNESQTNLEALVDVVGVGDVDNLYDTDFEMEELPPPLLEIQEPVIVNNRNCPTPHQLTGFSTNEHKVKLTEHFLCDKCDFSTHFALPKRLHLESHASNSLKLHCCEKCDYKTTRIVALKKHAISHKQKRKKVVTTSPLNTTSSINSQEQPPLLEPEQPIHNLAALKYSNCLNKDQKSDVLKSLPHSLNDLPQASKIPLESTIMAPQCSREVQDNRPVIYRTIGSPKHKRVLKIIGYLENGKKIFGSSAKRDERGRIISDDEEESKKRKEEKKKLRRSSRRINPKNIEVQDQLISAREQQNLNNEKPSKKGNQYLTFNCHNCDFTTSTQKSIDTHLAAHEANTLVLHYCVQCDFRTTKKSSLKEHHKNHLMEDGLLQITKKRSRGRPKVEPKLEPTKEPYHLRTTGDDSCPELDVFPLTNDIPKKSAVTRRREAGPPILEPQQPCNPDFTMKPCTVQLQRQNMEGYLANYETSMAGPEKLSRLEKIRRTRTLNLRSDELLHCDLCNFTTVWKYRATAHKFAHATNRLRIHACDKCDYKISNVMHLAKHRKQHDRPKSRKKTEAKVSVSVEPQMPLLSPDGAGTSYETKEELLQQLEENNERMEDSMEGHLPYLSDSLSKNADQPNRAEEEMLFFRLDKQFILHSAAKTYDEDKDFEMCLLEWFEKEILTNKTFGIKFLSQILQERGQ